MMSTSGVFVTVEKTQAMIFFVAELIEGSWGLPLTVHQGLTLFALNLLHILAPEQFQAVVKICFN